MNFEITCIAPYHARVQTVKPGHNQILDVIRAPLSWAVVWVHVFWSTGFRGPSTIQAGVLAVEGFVFLSGYVITQLLVSRPEPYRLFIFRRVMRLFPAFAVCLAIALILRPLTLGHDPLREQNENQFWWWHLAAHGFLVHGLIPSLWLPYSPMAMLPAAWSISLEMQLYLLAPLLLYWLRRSKLATILLVGAGLLVYLPQIAWRLNWVWSATGAFFPQRFVYFLAGMLVYLYLRSWVPSLKCWQPLMFLGQISYSTYLVHEPIVVILNRFIPAGWHRPERAVMLFVVAAPVILLSSWLLYRLVEVPGIELGRYLAKRFRCAELALFGIA